MRNVYRILVENPKWKIPLGRQKTRWEDNIKMVFKEMGVRCELD
jgi:hypothetical protein